MFKSCALSDIGLTRCNNEDVWVALPEIGFFALADGMGGHQAGEVAAKEALEHLSHSVKQLKTRNDPMELITELRSAIEKANLWVYQMGKESNTLSGMGTTLCCTVWTEEFVVYAHVGDSRVYRFRDSKLELLTRDHSLFAKWQSYGKLAEECETPFPYKNVITRAIGTSIKANPEIAISLRKPGDLYFLCTDGLSDVLTLDEMEKMMIQSKNIEVASKILIEQAKIKGSSDNITVLIIESEPQNATDLPGQQRHDRSRPESLSGDAGRLEWPSP